MDDHIVNPKNDSILGAAKILIDKLDKSNLLDSEDKIFIFNSIKEAIFSLPSATDGVYAKLSLSGPKRIFGKHEIFHYWEITQDTDGSIIICSSGYFFRQSSGGDRFTSMTWESYPGNEPIYTDFKEHLSLVDDADTFENEVQNIDLLLPGYELDLYGMD